MCNFFYFREIWISQIQCLHQLTVCKRNSILLPISMMVASVVFIFIVKFGAHYRVRNNNEPRCEIPFSRQDIHLLALLLFYRISSTCYCRSTILFSENLIFHNISSSSVISVTPDDETKEDATFSQTNILTKAAAAAAASDETSDSLYIVRNNLGDIFFDVGEYPLYNSQASAVFKCVKLSLISVTSSFRSW